jgi:hypothetical protein
MGSSLLMNAMKKSDPKSINASCIFIGTMIIFCLKDLLCHTQKNNNKSLKICTMKSITLVKQGLWYKSKADIFGTTKLRK